MSMMKAGFFETDITPAVGMTVPGSLRRKFVSRIHDPLKSRAMVIEAGGERIAIAGIDSLTVCSRKHTGMIREKASELCGIKQENIMIAASHTHSGGPFHGLLSGDFVDAPPLIRELLLEHGSIVDPAYSAMVVEQSVTSICEADARKEEAYISAGTGREDNVSFNRRFRMKNGRVFTHPGKCSPDIIEPAGPVDPAVGVLAVWKKNGDFMGCAVNFACHCTVAKEGVSADWVYYLERTIRSLMGRETGFVFLNGACGDVTQVNNLSPDKAEVGEKWSKIVGGSVGSEAFKVILRSERGVFNTVAAAKKDMVFKRRVPSRETVEKSLKIVEEGKRDEIKTTEWVFAREKLIIDYMARKQPAVKVEIQAVQAGPAIFLSNPAELFCGLGLEIKKGVDFPLVCVVELANGSAGYVPDPSAFEQAGGGYETVLTSMSNLETGAGKVIVEETIRLAERFKPENLPGQDRASASGGVGGVLPWSCGVLGPDVD